jgi:hypothetical protein
MDIKDALADLKAEFEAMLAGDSGFREDKDLVADLSDIGL